jgi:hypothetical protein
LLAAPDEEFKLVLVVQVTRMLNELFFLVLQHLFSVLSPLVFLLLSLSSHPLALFFEVLLKSVCDVDLVALAELFKQKEPV